MEGTLRSKDSKEVNENSLEETNNEEENDDVLPPEREMSTLYYTDGHFIFNVLFCCGYHA